MTHPTLQPLDTSHAYAVQTLWGEAATAPPWDSLDGCRCYLRDTASQRSIGAFVDGALVGFTSISWRRVRRQSHTGDAYLVVRSSVPDLDSLLLQHATQIADDWLRLDRLETAQAAVQADRPMWSAAGFAVQVRERQSLWCGGLYTDRIVLERLRPGFVPTPAGSLPVGVVRRSPLTVVIRAAQATDAASFVDHISRPGVIWGTLQLPWSTVEQWHQRLQQNEKEPRLVLLVALLGDQIVASAALSGELHPMRQHVWRLGMGVADDFTGARIGFELMRALLHRADRQLQALRVELDVYADNARAIALYEKFGFVREGLLIAESWRAGGFANCYRMARVLAVGQPHATPAQIRA